MPWWVRVFLAALVALWAVLPGEDLVQPPDLIDRDFNPGKPPRQLVLLHLDGSVDTLPERGRPLR